MRNQRLVLAHSLYCSLSVTQKQKKKQKSVSEKSGRTENERISHYANNYGKKQKHISLSFSTLKHWAKLSDQKYHPLFKFCRRTGDLLILTHISFSFFVNCGYNIEGASQASCRKVVRSKPFQNFPVGRVVINRWEFDQHLPKLLRYWDVLRRVRLELSYLYFIL